MKSSSSPGLDTVEKEEREDDEMEDKNQVIIAGFGRMGSIIGRFLRANNLQATFLDIDADNVDLLRKLGLKVFYGDASRVDLLRAAGAAEAKLLIVAVDQPAKTYRNCGSSPKAFPASKNHSQVEQLPRCLRAHSTWASNRFTGKPLTRRCRMGADALIMMGHRAFQVNRAALSFRKHNERVIREMAMHRKDHIEWIQQAQAAYRRH